MRFGFVITSRQFLAQAFALALCAAAMSALAGPAGSDTVADDEIPLLAIGPVGAIDAAKGTITVNGQTYVADGQTGVYLLGNSAPAETPESGPLGTLAINDHVAVYGEMMDAGLGLATIISQMPGDYVEGATGAYVRIKLLSNDATTAIATSGETVIDYTAALATGNLQDAKAGDILELYGLAYGESFYATAGSLAQIEYIELSGEESASLAIRGSGVRAIRGSGVRAIRGSGVRAIRGSGVRAIRGSGVRAIRGSGVRAIRGSGVRAIRGSGVRAIRGSGVRAIRGSGVRAIRGSGVRAIRGSGVRAIRGSGVR